MGSVPPLLSFLLMVAAGWVNRHQLIVIEFLQAENQLLKQRLRGKRIRFSDAERALLARKAKAVGRKALLELDTLVSPDTLMRWHRRLVAQKWDFSKAIRSQARSAIWSAAAFFSPAASVSGPTRSRQSRRVAIKPPHLRVRGRPSRTRLEGSSSACFEARLWRAPQHEERGWPRYATRLPDVALFRLFVSTTFPSCNAGSLSVQRLRRHACRPPSSAGCRLTRDEDAASVELKEMRAIASGDSTALQQLVDREAPRLLRFAFGLLGTERPRTRCRTPSSASGERAVVDSRCPRRHLAASCLLHRCDQRRAVRAHRR